MPCLIKCFGCRVKGKKQFNYPFLLLHRWQRKFLHRHRLPIDRRRQRPHRNLHRPIHEQIALHEKRQEFRQHHFGLGPQHHRMGRTDAVEFSHAQLALIGAPLCKDDVAFLEHQFAGLNIARATPAPNPQRIGIEMLQPDVVLHARFGWVVDAHIDVGGHLLEAPHLPAGFKSCLSHPPPPWARATPARPATRPSSAAWAAGSGG